MHSYQTITYKNIYPDIDLEFLTDPGSGFKYNFVIYPGGNLKSISINISGPVIGAGSSGSLLLETSIGTIEEKIPSCCCRTSESTIPMKAVFMRTGKSHYGFKLLTPLIAHSSLIIDPIPDRIWGTYFGGSGNDQAEGCTAYKNGDILLVGVTTSANNIATAGAFQQTLGGQQDAYIAKFNKDGQLLWATYYGGSNDDGFDGNCSIDVSGGIYVAGRTGSTNNIATPGAFKTTLSGTSDAMLVKFTPTGQRIWGTYYGGSSSDGASSSTIDVYNNVYMVGTTSSIDNIATSTGYQNTYGGGLDDGFLVKFDSSGSRLWGTYYGGAMEDGIYACSTDANFHVFVAGDTKSTDNIASYGAFQTTLNGANDGFLAEFDQSGPRIWGTYYGGEMQEGIHSCNATPWGDIYVSGATVSLTGMSTPGCYQPDFAGVVDDFIAKFNVTGSRIWGTYFGGPGLEDYGYSAIDDSACVFLVGRTTSTTGITTPNAFQQNFTGNCNDLIAKFDSSGQIQWATYYGGGNEVSAFGVSADTCGYVYMGGTTTSTSGIATPGSHQEVYGGGLDDAFLVKFIRCFRPDTAGIITGSIEVCAPEDSLLYYITAIASASGYLWDVPSGFTILSGQNMDSIIVSAGPAATSGNISVHGINFCGDGAASSKSISIHALPTPLISGNNTACIGSPEIYSAQAGMTNYQWSVSPGGIIVAGGTSADDAVTVQWNSTGAEWIKVNYTNSYGCADSLPVQFNVWVFQNVVAGISIVTNSDTVCPGTVVSFTAIPVNGGSGPTYQWKVNGISVGTNSPAYSYIPSNGDSVRCVLSSGDTCVLNNPASSNEIIMVINSTSVVGVSIVASANPFCPGKSVTFTAIPVNGGSSPVYQWKVNGANTGTNSPIFIYNPVSGDLVSCILTSDLFCVTGNPATSNTIIMNGTLAPVVTFTRCNDSITTTNAQPFRLKGGIPLGGIYSGPGVSNGIFYPAIAGVGTKTITYTFTNAALCSAAASLQFVIRNPSFVICGSDMTDPRDNKIYPTVQIGSQCWLAVNLNYGTLIPGNTSQRDNCIPEKYCYNDVAANCGQETYYQWDELMQYDETVSTQGLCPPGWHIPTEADWNTLFAHYINNGFAGSPLKYSGFSGFNALLSGARHLNRSWDFQGFATFFWSSTASGAYKAWSHGMNDTDPSVSFYPAFRSNAFSVRCLRD